MLKADVLIEAMRWIRQHRNKISVIKMGGSLMEDQAAIDHLLLDAVFMETVGMRPVIVHGGGAAISAAMNEAGIPPRFVQGRRYTDQPSLEIVKEVLGKEISNSLVQKITDFDGHAKALSVTLGTNVLYGNKLLLPDENGVPVDMGAHQGDVGVPAVRPGHARRHDRRVPVGLVAAGIRV